MNPRDRPSTLPQESGKMACQQDSGSDRHWMHPSNMNSTVKAEFPEQPHIMQPRRLPDRFSQEFIEHSTPSPGLDIRESPSPDLDFCHNDQLLYNYPAQQMQQPAISLPTHTSANGHHKHGSYSVHGSEQDHSFVQQQRLHHNLQQNNLPHQKHERALSSGGGTSVHGPSVSSPGGGHTYWNQDHSSQQSNPSQYLVSPTPYVQHQRNVSGGRGIPSDTYAAQKSHQTNRRRVIKEKAPKGDREEVWPPDVESAFMKALEVLPKLGRRKMVVNGKPCGRNELIADFIYRQTNKIRDRKQVSSHIQVLKNTRKNEPAFMRLLSDCPDGEDDTTLDAVFSECVSDSHSPAPSPHLDHGQMEHTPAGDKSVGLASIPPASSIPTLAQDFDSSLTFTTAGSFSHPYDQHQLKGRASKVFGMDANDHPFGTSGQSLYQQSVTTPDSAVSLSSEAGLRDYMTFEQTSRTIPSDHSKSSVPINWRRDTLKTAVLTRAVDSSHPLWPAAFHLWMQYSIMDPIDSNQPSAGDHDGITIDGFGFDGTRGAMGVHELARASSLDNPAFGTIKIHQLASEKCPALYDLYGRATCPFLLFKIGMNLTLDLEGTFENTCLFDSGESRTLRCSTIIYSFGDKVLESCEVRQATIAPGKFVYQFEFVNQFFNAFLSGIRSLGTQDEMEVALSGISLLQIYEDLDPRMEGTSPLLVMVYDFERGCGDVTPYRIIDGSDMLESLVC